MPTFPNEKGKIPGQTIKQFIIWWDSVFFIDFIYRKKFNIRFNSKEHRELNFIDIKIELEEDLFFNELKEEVIKRKESEDLYRVTGNWLNQSKVSISDEQFINIDLSKMKKQYWDQQEQLEKNARNGNKI